MISTEFLDAIWGRQGNGFIELRAFGEPPTSDVKRAWYAYPSDVAGFIGHCGLLNGTYNVFAGVLLREQQDGTAEVCKKQTPIMWADFDAKKHSRLHVFHQLNTIEVPPQIVIDSGHGFHAYWLLDKAVDVKEAQDVMKQIALKHDGDVVGDPARIMRVPGTLNVKSTPLPVRIVRFSPFERSRFADFINYAPQEAEYLLTEGDHKFESGTATEWIESRLQGDPSKGIRSEYVFGIICAMVRAGWGLDQVYEALVEAPAGEKIRELSVESGFRWVKTSYKNAVEAVALEQS